jgi:hypothetical protein
VGVAERPQGGAHRPIARRGSQAVRDVPPQLIDARGAPAHPDRGTPLSRRRNVREDMPDDDPLERLSSAELHDLAVRRARRHVDVRFFWRLMQVLPAAEAGAGELDDAEADVQRLSAHLDDVTESGRGEVAELLRPFYLDYLKRHGVKAP